MASSAVQAARSLFFARPVQDLATEVLQKMTVGGRGRPNGLHMRMEGDAQAHGFTSRNSCGSQPAARPAVPDSG